MRLRNILVVVLACAGGAPLQSASGSTCFGKPAQGHIVDSVALPAHGANFGPYAQLGVRLGRTFVHATVRDIVVGAYMDLQTTQAGIAYLYGETGLRNGGPMPPHRTHQAGTSVDFMVPVRDGQGRPATLPASAANRYGYDLEFDSDGRLGDLRIDFDAIAAHLHALDQRSRASGAGIARVIFDPALTRRLLKQPAGDRIRTLPFMKSTPWIRHDEHYHVDFAVRCGE